VHVPGRDAEASPDDLKASEVEIGMGIHNEPGSERKTADLPDLVKTMLAHMLDSHDKDRNFLDVGEQDDTVLLVNNLGGVSVLEMGGITHEVVTQLDRDWKIHPMRIISGTFMTSLNGLGFSITLLRLRDTGLGSGRSMLDLLDAPAEATGWSAAITTKTWQTKSNATRDDVKGDEEKEMTSNFTVDPAQATKALKGGLDRVIAAEPDVTHYDTIVGDGDCGIGLKRGAEAILKHLESSSQQATSDPLALLSGITKVVETTMDGTSGALYSIYLNALLTSISSLSPSSQKTPIAPEVWGQAHQASLKALSKYTPARPGDRTLVDALVPFVDTLAKTGDTKAAASAAVEGARKTKEMKASLGRSVYVGGEGWQSVPDPGAHGLAEFLQGLADAL
jgi:triose/dihydroxyacetone kinase / FAD-AMP lyase (cyclizing)